MLYYHILYNYIIILRHSNSGGSSLRGADDAPAIRAQTSELVMQAASRAPPSLSIYVYIYIYICTHLLFISYLYTISYTLIIIIIIIIYVYIVNAGRQPSPPPK